MRHRECNHPFGNVSKGVPSVRLELLPLALFIYSVKADALSLIPLFPSPQKCYKAPAKAVFTFFGFHILLGFVTRLSNTAN